MPKGLFCKKKKTNKKQTGWLERYHFYAWDFHHVRNTELKMLECVLFIFNDHVTDRTMNYSFPVPT